MSTARDPGFVTRLRAAARGEVRSDEALARYSTYRIGGPATVLLAASVEDVQGAVRLTRAEGVPLFPVGLGSNVLLLQFNQGAMPHEMFMNQIRRFASEVLPDLQRHTVTKVAP